MKTTVEVPQIKAYMHCAQCLEERPATISPAEWARISVGWTPKGLQVWCARHERNIANLDFLGQKVSYASTECAEEL